jgi:diaminohydroxyphosphoribosylaminopyrimidine deaminase/5-amino-6-(5-phosphoribosylamino)uracil reductase
MNRCLELAFQGNGWAQPNPLVGSVIVHNQQIISEGFHRKFGENHAERMAILSLENKELLKESTLYVNLEPCSHFGKTPPCSDLICDYQIPKVVVGMRDPNPLVNGNGIKRLKNSGIEVVENVLTESCNYLNRKFIVNQTQKRPFITLKRAESSDGFYAPIPRKKHQITGDTARKFTHRLRQAHQAILVGIGTWELDQPLLTDRCFGGPQPIKLVMTANELWCFTDHFKWSGCQFQLPSSISEWNSQKFHRIRMHGEDFNSQYPSKAEFISEFCYQNGWNSLLIEGGSSVWNAFIDANLVDELVVYRSQKVELESGLRVPQLNNSSNSFQAPICIDLDEYEYDLSQNSLKNPSKLNPDNSELSSNSAHNSTNSDQLVLYKWKR